MRDAVADDFRRLPGIEVHTLDDVPAGEELPVVVLIPQDALFQKSLSNLKEVESRGGRIIVVTDAPSPDLEEVAWEVLSVPKTSEFLTPLLLTIPLQLLAYHVAVYRGTDVDQPRNLAKSVTVE